MSVHDLLVPRAFCASFVALFVLLLTGCGGFPSGGDSSAAQPTLGSTILDDGAGDPRNAGPLDGRLIHAQLVRSSEQTRTIRGTIQGANDVAVYDLGPVQPGDHVLVNMDSSVGLDGALALFDEFGSLLLVDDHRNIVNGQRGTFVEVTLRRPSAACYLAAAAAPGFGASGDFTLAATRTPDRRLPDVRPDEILLVFDGGRDVRIGGRAPIQVPVFDAADMMPSLAGRTKDIVARVVARIRSDYEPFNVTIHSTSEGTTFDGLMTRIYFGTFDESLLGVAQGVDEFNAQQAQNAIVFTDTFGAFARLNPSVEEISHALANVASHEIGHLLGLVHTSDPRGIMDVTASLSELLVPQHFRRSPIHEQVFPLGYLDEVQTLLDNVGGDSNLAFARMFEFDRQETMPRTKSDARAARMFVRFSSCDLQPHEHPE